MSNVPSDLPSDLKYTRSHDSVLALDVKNRRVGFARATYFSDRHGDRKHVPVTIAVDLNEIKNIHLIGTIGNKGASYTFEFHRPIPPENDSCSLSMVGNPGEIDVLVEEITSLLRDHHA